MGYYLITYQTPAGDIETTPIEGDNFAEVEATFNRLYTGVILDTEYVSDTMHLYIKEN